MTFFFNVGYFQDLMQIQVVFFFFPVQLKYLVIIALLLPSRIFIFNFDFYLFKLENPLSTIQSQELICMIILNC